MEKILKFLKEGKSNQAINEIQTYGPYCDNEKILGFNKKDSYWSEEN